MGKHDVMKMQTCVLKVNINCSCEGCIQKVRKILQKIQEVYSVSIDANHGKVTVTGNHLDPSNLILKLRKSGKHAQLWGTSTTTNNNMHNQFKNIMHMGAMPHSNNNNNKSQKYAAAPPPANFKQNNAQQMKVTPNNKKSVKFDVSDDDSDDHDYCLTGSDDDFDDDLYDDDDDEGFGHGNNKLPNKKMAPMMMGKGQGNYGQNGMMMNGAGAMAMMMNGKNGGSNGGKKGKKNELDIEFPLSLKKSGSSKKGGGHDKCYHEDGKDKSSVIQTGLGFFGFGKKSKKEKDFDNKDKNGGKNNNKGAKKVGGDQGDDWAHGKNSKKSGGGGGGYHDIDVFNHGGKGKSGKNLGGNPNGGGGHMSMGPMGNYPRAQMGGMPTLSSAGMMNNGYNHQGNGYNNNNQQQQQQQYMAMMNQQRMMMMNGNNDMYQYQQHPMMYGRPQAPLGYGPPPPQADPITHIFNDENTESCSIM